MQDNQEIAFTGMFKYVETGKVDVYGEQIFKRKRVFRMFTKSKKQISSEQKEEIDHAFFLFDKDRSGTIDTAELRDAMKALGIFMKKEEVKQYMMKVDKDGSGSIDQNEFIGLMAEILSKRNQEEEIRKVFRCYDNDDDGQISIKNLWECADILEMYQDMTDENVEQMITLGDRKNRGYVDINDFMWLMR